MQFAQAWWCSRDDPDALCAFVVDVRRRNRRRPPSNHPTRVGQAPDEHRLRACVAGRGVCVTCVVDTCLLDAILE